MSNIKLEQYKIFKEAAFTLSFSQAARNLYITQSAVSQTITLLEKELDTSLFIRHRKGVTLFKLVVTIGVTIENSFFIGGDIILGLRTGDRIGDRLQHL